ncbi:MAG: 2-amino-4-hydroxy-6-hydroxymethyldihydropteridine diphosphokinase [Deltaproteobacteria bacterium]|nr:2-amino-4-hydroxy-6-hydroxymethyldihydropteridine diphosphokinase [Deltaproteobacteria bacterium]
MFHDAAIAWRRVAIGLGSSLGDRRGRLELTVRQLHQLPGLEVLRVSRWRRSPPLRGSVARGWFLNGVVLVGSQLPMPELMRRCQSLERRAGRRSVHWGDRPLDLDLLLAEGECWDTPPLTLPHPAIAQRDFVLLPLLEVWPEAVDPRSGQGWARAPRPRGPLSFPTGVMGRLSAAPTHSLRST